MTTEKSISHTQYNKISQGYAELVAHDPAKQYLQYPCAARLLGDISGKHILDVGCGEGYLSRVLARRGAQVVGYDISEQQIARAKHSEANEPLGIQYKVTGPQDFTWPKQFDAAVAVLVLHYSLDQAELTAFFKSTYRHIKPGRPFVVIAFNPEFKSFGKLAYERKIDTLPNGKLRVNFYRQNKLMASADFSDFTKKNYEQAAQQAGFAERQWLEVPVEPRGLQKLGCSYWQSYLRDPLYIAFQTIKPM